MLIKVVYRNDKHDMIKPFLLDSFIFSNKIKKFLRSDGWTTIGIDKTRGKGGYYEGIERRKNILFSTETNVPL
jgi:hypothetical protein